MGWDRRAEKPLIGGHHDSWKEKNLKDTSCTLDKAHRVKTSKCRSTDCASELLKLAKAGMCSPPRLDQLGSLVFYIFMVDYSSYVTIYPIRHESYSMACCVDFENMAELRPARPIQASKIMQEVNIPVLRSKKISVALELTGSLQVNTFCTKSATEVNESQIDELNWIDALTRKSYKMSMSRSDFNWCKCKEQGD